MELDSKKLLNFFEENQRKLALRLQYFENLNIILILVRRRSFSDFKLKVVETCQKFNFDLVFSDDNSYDEIFNYINKYINLLQYNMQNVEEFMSTIEYDYKIPITSLPLFIYVLFLIKINSFDYICEVFIKLLRVNGNLAREMSQSLEQLKFLENERNDISIRNLLLEKQMLDYLEASNADGFFKVFKKYFKSINLKKVDFIEDKNEFIYWAENYLVNYIKFNYFSKPRMVEKNPILEEKENISYPMSNVLDNYVINGKVVKIVDMEYFKFLLNASSLNPLTKLDYERQMFNLIKNEKLHSWEQKRKKLLDKYLSSEEQQLLIMAKGSNSNLKNVADDIEAIISLLLEGEEEKELLPLLYESIAQLKNQQITASIEEDEEIIQLYYYPKDEEKSYFDIDITELDKSLSRLLPKIIAKIQERKTNNCYPILDASIPAKAMGNKVFIAFVEVNEKSTIIVCAGTKNEIFKKAIKVINSKEFAVYYQNIKNNDSMNLSRRKNG